MVYKLIWALLATPAASLDFQGDGGATIAWVPGVASLDTVYNQPGLYRPTISVTDSSGAVHTASTLVEVVTPADIDAMVLPLWSSMTTSLQQGDATTAAAGVVGFKRDTHLRMFNTLDPAARQSLEQILPSPTFVDLYGGQAEYQMLRNDAGTLLSHLVLFARDDDGVWRLRFF